MYAKGDYVKIEFRTERHLEWMWVRVENNDPERRVVFGTLHSQPIVMTDLHLGQQLAVNYADIRDHRTPASFRPV